MSSSSLSGWKDGFAWLVQRNPLYLLTQVRHFSEQNGLSASAGAVFVQKS